jgi:hypothetical protein
MFPPSTKSDSSFANRILGSITHQHRKAIELARPRRKRRFHTVCLISATEAMSPIVQVFEYRQWSEAS